MAQAKHCSITRRGILSALAVLPATSPRDPGICYAVSSVGRNKRRAATRAERLRREAAQRAEFIIGPADGRTRWLTAPYKSSLFVLDPLADFCHSSCTLLARGAHS